MEDGRKRKESDNFAGEDEEKRYKLTENVDEEDGIMEWLMFDEDSASELSKLLDVETEVPQVKVKFIDDPYTTPLVFQSSSAYVTINGNEEMCGSSFSDELSVMASVDMAGMKRRSAWGNGGAREGMEGCGDVDEFLVNRGFDQEEDDEMWVKFLGEDFV